VTFGKEGIPFIKPSGTSDRSGEAGGGGYSVIGSQARKTVLGLYNFFKNIQKNERAWIFQSAKTQQQKLMA
jgi:hypothetical protein